jgi:hypothetical protein
MIGHEIIGDDRQAVVISMTPGDEVRAGAGAMTEVKRDFGGSLGALGDLIGGDS